MLARSRSLMSSGVLMLILSSCPCTRGIAFNSILRKPPPSSASASSSSSSSRQRSSSSSSLSSSYYTENDYGSTNNNNSTFSNIRNNSSNRSIRTSGLGSSTARALSRETAGGGDGDGDGDGLEQHDHNDDNDGWNLGMAIALFASYFTVMAAKCALPSTLSILTGPNSGLATTTISNILSKINNNKDKLTIVTPTTLMATTLSISTLSITLGKTVLGPLIDAHSGVLCLRVALAALGTALAVIACTSQFHVFALAWIAVDFIFSACWASSLNAIHWEFAERWWPDMIGVLAVAARAGNAVSFLGFAWVLGTGAGAGAGGSVVNSGGGGGGQGWRMVFWVSALIQVVPLVLLSLYSNESIHRGSDGNDNAGSNEQTTSAPTKTVPNRKIALQTSLRVLRNEASTLEFWMHLLSRSALMLIASFLLFVPSYMSTAYSLSTAASTRVGSIYALGSLLAVSLGSARFSTLPTNGHRIAAVLGMLGVLAGCCLLQMAHVSGAVVLSPAVGVVSMFVWGLAFSIPFYIPPSLHALRRGGRESSATIADAFDLGGYTLLAMFTGYVVSRQQQDIMAWYIPFKILLACTIISIISLPIALSLEEKPN